VGYIPALKRDKNVALAAEIAEDKKRDRKKRNALAKEVMAGRRINKILSALHGQWHIIDLHDCITREFLINNTQDFFDSLVTRIRWPSTYDEYDLPYKLLDNSCSNYQYIFERRNHKNYDEGDNSGLEKELEKYDGGDNSGLEKELEKYDEGDNSGLEKELEKCKEQVNKAKEEYNPGKKYKSRKSRKQDKERSKDEEENEEEDEEEGASSFEDKEEKLMMEKLRVKYKGKEI
jgi:hypothetical protein